MPGLSSVIGEAEADRVRTLIAVAVMDRESLVGCVEAINKNEGEAFDDDDLFILTSLAGTASNALHNAAC